MGSEPYRLVAKADVVELLPARPHRVCGIQVWPAAGRAHSGLKRLGRLGHEPRLQAAAVCQGRSGLRQ